MVFWPPIARYLDSIQNGSSLKESRFSVRTPDHSQHALSALQSASLLCKDCLKILTAVTFARTVKDRWIYSPVCIHKMLGLLVERSEVICSFTV